MPYINMMWSAPFQIALCCYFMWREVGAASFAGVAIVVLAIPINGAVASITRKLQLEQTSQTDE